jgi:hypothetical protein
MGISNDIQMRVSAYSKMNVGPDRPPPNPKETSGPHPRFWRSGPTSRLRTAGRLIAPAKSSTRLNSRSCERFSWLTEIRPAVERAQSNFVDLGNGCCRRSQAR